jgi:alkaline phosphatase
MFTYPYYFRLLTQSPIFLLLLFFSGCAYQKKIHSSNTAPRNIILLIGDGMGPQELGLHLLDRSFSRSYEYIPLNEREKQFGIEYAIKQGDTGLVLSSPLPHSLINDSACAATALATGVECYPETLGLDSAYQPVSSILELAKLHGKATGLVSDTMATHATPAGFYAHIHSRYDEETFAAQSIAGAVDVLFSGGLKHFLPKSLEKRKRWEGSVPKYLLAAASRSDDRDLLEEASNNGYTAIFTHTDLKRIAAADAPQGKVLGLFSASGMKDYLSYTADKEQHTEPSLPQMTEKALALLAQNPNGFFLMVEAGQIDWACHDNDAGMLLAEMRKFNDTLREIIRWAEKTPNTLVLITADHETGGAGFSYTSKAGENGLSSAATAMKQGKHVTTNLGKKNTLKNDLIAYTSVMNYLEPKTLERLRQQKLPLKKVIREFHKLPAFLQKADTLSILLTKNLPYRVTVLEAALMLEQEMIHKKDGTKLLVAKIDDYDVFYPDPLSRLTSRIARVTAKKTGVTWSTGNHTSTPVLITAFGPQKASEQFHGVMTHAEVGRKMREWLFGK